MLTFCLPVFINFLKIKSNFVTFFTVIVKRQQYNMLKIEATKSTPSVNISVKNCIFEIKGLSYANDSDIFYKQIIEYIESIKIWHLFL